MPFDGTRVAKREIALSNREILDAAAAGAGLAPVSEETLAMHKQAQVLLNGPSWAYRHRRKLRLGMAACAGAGWLSFVALGAFDATGPGLAVFLASILCFAGFGLLPMRGRARWIERPIDELDLVHPQIRDAGLKLKDMLPETGFRIGELFQERERLDPYLIAEFRGERLVLGIWDGAALIACA